MQTNPEKPSRGGRRDGAGRKKSTNPSVSLSIRVPADVAEILSRVPNRSAYIIDAIRAYASR